MSERFRAPRKQLDKVEVDRLVDFAQLVQFPGWQGLRDHYDRLVQKQVLDWGDALLVGDPPDPKEVAFRAGFWAGVRAVLDTPSQAETRLARELEKRKEPA